MEIFDCLELDMQEPTDYSGRFIFQPLNIGDGITIGNILRRVLLSNLPGISIVGVRIAGVNNELTTIPGVREDSLEISLNLKQIICKSKDQKNTIGRLKIQGPAIITASDIKLPLNLEIVNPDVYIATLAENYSLEMELMFNWGKGYTLMENKSIISTRDLIKIDAIFMPVLRVGFSIETSFPETSETLGTYEKLIIDIRTNGSITPLDAISLASQNIIDWFKNIKDLQMKLEKSNTVKKLNLKTNSNMKKKNLDSLNNIKPDSLVEIDLSLQKDKSNEENNRKIIPLEKSDLSLRVLKSLRQVNINFIHELLTYSLADLKKIKGLGPKSIEEIEIMKLLYINEINLFDTLIETDLSLQEDKFIEENNIRIIPLEKLDLSPRVLKSLKQVNINFIGELLNYSLADLKKVKGLGPKSIEEIEIMKLLYINEINLFDTLMETDLSSQEDKSKKENNIKIIPIEELLLSPKAFKSLKEMKINFIGELLHYSQSDLKKFKNLNRQLIEEICISLDINYQLELRID